MSILPTAVTVLGRRTSVRLEPEYCDALAEIGAREQLSQEQLLEFVREHYPGRRLTSAIRIFVTLYYRDVSLRPAEAA